MRPIIVVEDLSKKYSRNANDHLSYGLRDLLSELIGRVSELTLRKDEFLAVDNISFHLYPGDSLALIGRNGSGKTTLLKMLNGLIKPDAGKIIVDGTTQALINLGAGFNPVLSGRENIYISAALNGFDRRQTNAIVEEIVEFSGIGEFLDSPVQTYSKGMQARLGFSVAIHLQPNILLIDEILSVGDYAFQNKCYVKMHELKKLGVTIILVSHSITHVVQLCERAIWIDHGRIIQEGASAEITQAYLKHLDEEEIANSEKAKILKRDRSSISLSKTTISAAELYGPIYNETDSIEDLSLKLLIGGQGSDHLHIHDELIIEYSFRLRRSVTDLNVSLVFFRKEGMQMATISTLNGDLLKNVHEGNIRCRITIFDFHLNPGSYVLVMPIHEGKSYLYRDIVKEFIVKGGGKMTWGQTDFTYDYKLI